MNDTNTAILTTLDNSRLKPRFWLIIALLVLNFVTEFFDFFTIGYIVAIVAPLWKLTYGQTAIILLSAGVGAIVGALISGVFSDKYGRKALLVGGSIICSIASALVAIIPEGAWISLTILRFIIGFGLAASATAQNAIIPELFPTRYRTVLSSAMNAPAALGIFLAAATVSAMLGMIGWRGIAAAGAAVGVIAIIIYFVMPESVRWLASQGRNEEARKALGKLVYGEVPPIPASAPAAVASESARSGFRELAKDPRRFWFLVVVWLGLSTMIYGVLLWGPTILVLLMKISPREAAFYFMYLSLAGFAGRLFFLAFVQYFGRKTTGAVTGICCGLLLAAAGLYYDVLFMGLPLFVICLIAANFFTDPSFANIAPMTAEIYPVNQSARAVGFGQAVNGVGKIAGPLFVSLLAGSTNIVAPQATVEAIVPSMLFFAGCAMAAGVAYLVAGLETHGKPLVLHAG